MFDCFFQEYKKSIHNDSIVFLFKSAPRWKKITSVIMIVLIALLCVSLIVNAVTGRYFFFTATFYGLTLIIMFIVGIQIDKENRNNTLSNAKKIRETQIEKIIDCCRHDEFALDSIDGIEWLIQECNKRIDRPLLGNRTNKAIALSFDKVIYPLIAFICGLAANQLSFSSAVEAVLWIVVAASVLALFVPEVIDMLGRNRRILKVLLDDLNYIKSSKYRNEIFANENTNDNTEVAMLTPN